MQIYMPNVRIAEFKDTFIGENILLPGSVLEKFDWNRVKNLPIIIRVGAVKKKIGVIRTVRKGREAVFADLLLDLEPGIAFDYIGDKLIKGLNEALYLDLKPSV